MSSSMVSVLWYVSVDSNERQYHEVLCEFLVSDKTDM